jgi:hypothetical protein
MDEMEKELDTNQQRYVKIAAWKRTKSRLSLILRARRHQAIAEQQALYKQVI